jgi:NADPH2:quinone reductase
MQVRATCRWSAARTELGISPTGNGCSSEDLDRHTARRHSARLCRELNLARHSCGKPASQGFQVVIDYVWGRPVEVFLAAITRGEFAVIKSETRFVQVGESAAPTICPPAAVLRSTPLTILGTAGIPPRDVLLGAFQQVMAYAAKGRLQIDTERVPLADIENARQRDTSGRRLVMMT